MIVIGKELLNSQPVWLKFIFNDEAIAFAQPTLQHREVSGGGLSYRDEGGNALAGMIVNGGIEIRGHSILRPERTQVQQWWRAVCVHCQDPYLSSLKVSLQGKSLFEGR